MNAQSKVGRAIAAILGGTSVGFSCCGSAKADTSSDAIQEVTVTAQRRTENAQDVPIAIQALTTEVLTQLNVATLDQFVRYLPNVASPSGGPGQSQIFMRGLSTGTQTTVAQGSVGQFPNVAIYLDDQSGQLTARNLDIYAADLERVEVLEGPQGTLFGAGAQAGVVRYITNKPKINATEGYAKAGYGVTAGGNPNSDVTAVLNLPLLTDAVALRAVIYNDHRGGYINNVPGTFTRRATDLGISYANFATACTVGTPTSQGLCTAMGSKPTAFGVPPGSAAVNNNAFVANAINPVDYHGTRLSVLWDLNEAWNVLIAQTYQTMDAEGVFYQMPVSSDGVPLPPRSVTLFNPSYNKDRFENTAWTISGRLHDLLSIIYTGSYLVRNVDQVQDYVNYARGVYADYYQCHGAEPAKNLSAQCFSPSTTWQEHVRNTHLSHEIRFSTPDDWRLRGIVGALWEKQRLQDQSNFLYKTLPPCTDIIMAGCLSDVAALAGATTVTPGVRNDNVAFFYDIQRGYRQYAFFASVDYDLIPKMLTLTAGTRYYDFLNSETGATVTGFTCYEAGPAPCTTGGTNINALHLRTVEKGSKGRANVTWHVTPDALLYFTWSQGFRPGVFNSGTSCHVPGIDGIKQFCTPVAAKSDDLTNKEIGWKTQFLADRIQWNGAVYQENWNNVQFRFYDPGQLGNLGFSTNGPNYRIRGVETTMIARVTSKLTVQGGASWNSSTQTNSPFLVANNPALLQNPATKAEFGQPLTAIANPYGPVGSPSSNSPPLQFNLRLRHEWKLKSYDAFCQFGATHTGHSFTQSSNNPSLSAGSAISTNKIRFENPPITEYDASAGLARGAWAAQLYGQNLTNVNSSIFTSTDQFVVSQVVTRPRILGVNFTYNF